DPSAGALGGVASTTPHVAKVAAGITAVAVTGATVATLETRPAGTAAVLVSPVPVRVPPAAERPAAPAPVAPELEAVALEPTPQPEPRVAVARTPAAP